jgi:hypothetical protein
MKKLLLVIALFISMMVTSQTFTRHYDYVAIKEGSYRTVTELMPTDITVVFSGNDKGDIIVLSNLTDNLSAVRYYKTGRIFDGKSKDGFKFRYIETRNEEKEKVIIQLFDIGVFRIHKQGTTWEYQQSPN